MKKLLTLLVLLMTVAMVFAQGGTEGSKAEAPRKLSMMFSSGGAGKALAAAAEKFGEERGVEMDVLTFPVGEVYEKQILAAEKRLTNALRAAAKQADSNTRAQKNTADVLFRHYY